VRPRPLSPTRSPTCSACACSRKPPARAPSSHVRNASTSPEGAASVPPARL
jgi:hypothetical protein